MIEYILSLKGTIILNRETLEFPLKSRIKQISQKKSKAFLYKQQRIRKYIGKKDPI